MRSPFSTQSVTRLLFLILLAAGVASAQPGSQTPTNLKIAFIGDQGASKDSKRVLDLIVSEGADAVVHSGDLDYDDDPQGWEEMINDKLGPNFPYFVSIGNHDEKAWDGGDGYQARLEARLNRIGLPWDGDLGVNSSVKFRGLQIILVGPGVMGKNHAEYVRDVLAQDKSVWSIASWHKNMKDMQVGGKDDDAGWDVYRESRLGGAIIATGHEHSYSRTHLLSNIEDQSVIDTSDTLRVSMGETFVFVNGLGGKSIREQKRSGAWWASIYTEDQDAKSGVLFGVFNKDGNERLADFYFKNIDGEIIDQFQVVSEVEDAVTSVGESGEIVPSDFALEQNYPNPFNPETAIRFRVPKTMEVKLYVTDLLGRRVRTLVDGTSPAGRRTVVWDGKNALGKALSSGQYLYTLEAGGLVLTRKLTLLK